MANRDMHIGRLTQEVEEIVLENRAGLDLGNIKVHTWVDSASHMNMTVSRINPRTGYEKNIAIPHELVTSVVAALITLKVDFDEKVEEVRHG